MKKIFDVTLLAFALNSTPISAQDFGPQPDLATKQEILDLREKAWRTWFSNDQKGFKQAVPEELMAMGWDGGTWEDRVQTLQSMKDFATSGQTLATLEFPKNIFQHYGNVIILYTSFRLVLKSKEGILSETKGRGTEIFVKRNGKWIHTGWHLDKIAS